MYHRLDEINPSSSSLTVSPQSFVRQIDCLEKKAFRLLSLDEVIDLKVEIPLTGRAVALTFDDGYRDNYENGFALLIQRRKTAALFVVVNWIGTKDFLTWREIRELSEAGITIGSHSLSHRWLPDIGDEGELKSEIVDSKKRIEDELGKEVRHFSYPIGGINQRVAEIVRRAGYSAGWIAGGQPSSSLQIQEPLLSLRRVKISPSDGNLIHFLAKAYGIKSLFWGMKLNKKT